MAAKKTPAAYKIKKRKDGRYQVVKRFGGFINGRDKIKILLDAGLIKTKLPAEKAPEGAPADAAAPVAAAPAAEAPKADAPAAT